MEHLASIVSFYYIANSPRSGLTVTNKEGTHTLINFKVRGAVGGSYVRLVLVK